MSNRGTASLGSSTIISSSNLFDGQLQQQEDFFKKFFGFRLDLSGVKIPNYQQGFDRLIVVPRELVEPWKLGDEKPRIQPQNWIYDVCGKKFKCWRYANDLDVAISIHDRHPQNGTYAILARDRVEADKENKNLSACHFWDNNIATEGVIERMLHGLKYWDEKGKHLDPNTITLCSGSRDGDGVVPGVGFYSDGREVGVSCCLPDYYFGYIRSRSAVSMPAEPRVSAA